MDTISFSSYCLSSVCHLIFVAWAFLNVYEAAPEIPEPETEIQAEQDKAIASIKKTVPEFAVLIPEREAVAQGASPKPILPQLDDAELFEQALLKPIGGGEQIIESETPHKANNVIELPKVNIDQAALLHFENNAENKKNKHQNHSNDLESFVWVVNITIGNHYYKKWHNAFRKKLSNHEIHLLIHTENSAIMKAELLKGSGNTEFDTLLINWIHHVNPNGPSIPDGQYPMVLKLR